MKYGENLNSVKALEYLENSYLKELLEDDDITDISYNGESLFYLHNFLGRKKSNIVFKNEMARDFLRQLANLSEKQFSYQSPLLNISVGPYRVNGVFSSIGRYQNNKVYTFSIRKSFKDLKVEKNSYFMSDKLEILFKTLIDNNISIIIGGVTGSGKTELQKFLMSKFKENSRVIVIDEVLELANIESSNYIDLSIWQSDTSITVQELIRNALRSNPDWLILSEARGKEMYDVLSSAMTGHPIITTMHAFDVDSIPSRVVNMILSSDKDLNPTIILKDFIHHISIGVFIRKKEEASGIIRYISDVAEFTEDGSISYIFRKINGKDHYFPVSKRLLEKLDKNNMSNEFKNTFIKEI